MYYSACVSSLFLGRPVSEHLADVAASGLTHYEFWDWWTQDLSALAAAQEESRLSCAAMCTRFISLTDPAKREEYVQWLGKTVEACQRLGCKTIISQVGQELSNMPRIAQHQSIADGLKASLPVLEGSGITLVIEPLNTLVNHKGYYLWQSQEAFDIVTEVSHPQIKVLYDLYHQHIMSDLRLPHILQNLDKIGHFHMAGYPGRHEPLDPNEIDYPSILRAIRDAGYAGSVGLEYFPTRPAAPELKLLAEKLRAL